MLLIFYLRFLTNIRGGKVNVFRGQVYQVEKLIRRGKIYDVVFPDQTVLEGVNGNDFSIHGEPTIENAPMPKTQEIKGKHGVLKQPPKDGGHVN